MKSDPALHHRRSIRLKGYDYTQAGAYFVTLVTQGRAALLGEVVDGAMRLSALGRVAEDCWRAIPDHFPDVELGAFVVMPNHVHGIIILGRGTIDCRGTIYRAPTTKPTNGSPTDTDRAPTTKPTNGSPTDTDRAPTTTNGSPTDTDRAPTIDCPPADTERDPMPEQFQKPVAGSLATILRAYKAAVSRRINREFHLTAIWQRNYYEHIIRNEGEHDRIHRYIAANPSKWDTDRENLGK